MKRTLTHTDPPIFFQPSKNACPVWCMLGKTCIIKKFQAFLLTYKSILTPFFYLPTYKNTSTIVILFLKRNTQTSKRRREVHHGIIFYKQNPFKAKKTSFKSFHAFCWFHNVRKHNLLLINLHIEEGEDV